MISNQQPVNQTEIYQTGKQEKESNLSPTAQLVNDVLSNYVTPIIRETGLTAKANEIFEKKLPADSPEVVNFCLECRKKQSEIYNAAEDEGLEDKGLAVITNYFSKLVANVKNAEKVAEVKPESSPV